MNNIDKVKEELVLKIRQERGYVAQERGYVAKAKPKCSKKPKRKTLTREVMRLKMIIFIIGFYSVAITLFTIFYIWLSCSLYNL